MVDVSSLAITGSGLIEPRERKATQAQPSENSHPAYDDRDDRTEGIPPPLRPPAGQPTSPRSTRSSRLRRRRSLSNRPELSASLQQLGAVHQQLQAMITSKESQVEASTAAPPTLTQPDTAFSPSAPSTSPLLQRLMGLVKEAESQQQSQLIAQSIAGTIVHSSPTDSDELAMRSSPLTTNETQTASTSHQSAVGSFSSSVAPIGPAVSIEISQSHLTLQLRQLSEHKEQAVSECVAVQSRLQAAIAQLQSLLAQCSSDILRVEDEYVRAVEQCTMQHTQRVQQLH